MIIFYHTVCFGGSYVSHLVIISVQHSTSDHFVNSIQEQGNQKTSQLVFLKQHCSQLPHILPSSQTGRNSTMLLVGLFMCTVLCGQVVCGNNFIVIPKSYGELVGKDYDYDNATYVPGDEIDPVSLQHKEKRVYEVLSLPSSIQTFVSSCGPGDCEKLEKLD